MLRSGRFAFLCLASVLTAVGCGGGGGGGGPGPAVLSISDGPGYDYGQRAVGSSTDHSFTVNNTGQHPATAMTAGAVNAPFSFSGGSFPGTGGTCGASLAASDSCTVVITYAPTSSGVTTASLSFTYNDGSTSQTASRNIQATAATPALLTISDGATYDFTVKAVGSSTDKTFTVSNSGGSGATALNAGALAAPFSFKGGSYPGTGGTCGASLSSTASCTVLVTFAPGAIGTYNGSLSLNYQDGAANHSATRAMTGRAIVPALLTFAEAPNYDYGTRATLSATDHTFTLTNSGGVTATSLTALAAPGAPFYFKGGNFPGIGGSCQSSLFVGSSCSIVVTFAPNTPGTSSGSVGVGYSDGASSQTASCNLSGVGTAQAFLVLSDGPSYDFGTVAISTAVDHTFTLINTGKVNATSITASALPTAFTFKGGGGYPGSGGTCGGTVAPTDLPCTIIVTYTAVSGVSSGNLNLVYNNGASGGQNATRPISGTGTTRAFLSISDGPSYSYGVQAAGSSTDHTFVITNSGAQSATAMTPVALSAPFRFKGGTYPGTGGSCAASLLTNNTCTVVVTYAPATTGVNGGTLSIGYNDSVSSQTANRPIAGSATNPALLSISDGPTFNYGTLANGSSNNHTFTISNSGGVAATVMAASASPSAPFTFQGSGTYPGSTGTCSTTLAPSATCTVVVTYAPSASGTTSSGFTISYNDGAQAQSVNRAVSGTGAPPASISISDGATYFYGTQATGSQTDHTFTVTNNGGVSATGLGGTSPSAPFAFKGGTYPGTGGTCTTGLVASGTCTVVVTFAPTVLGFRTATLSLNYNDGVAGQTSNRGLSGTGANPASLAFSAFPLYSYGTRAQGSSADHNFTLTNSGGVPATSLAGSGLAAPFTFKGGTYPGQGGNCSTTLGVASSCTVVVTYAPSSLGPALNTLTITYANGAVSGQTATVGINGISAPPALLTFSGQGNFGTIGVGTSADTLFQVTNGGGVPATGISASSLVGVITYKGGTFPGVGGTCSATLAPNATCVVSASFAPTQAGAAPTATITLTYNNGVSPLQNQTANQALNGVGTFQAVLRITDFPTQYYSYGLPQDGPTFHFGVQGNNTSADHTFTITNVGAGSASSIAGLSFTAPFSFKGGGAFPGAGGTCGANLGVGNSCTVVLTFTPTASGLQTATLTVNYNDGVSSRSATRPIDGSGTDLAVLAIYDFPGIVLGSSFDYGTLGVGVPKDQTFIVTNSGGHDATTVVDGGTLANGFAYKGSSYPGVGGTCTATIAKNSSCTVVVTFTPASPGSVSSSVRLNYNDGASNRSASRSLTGTGTNQALLTIRDTHGAGGLYFDYGPQGTNTSTDAAFMVINSGAGNASSMTSSALSVPFSFKGGTYPGAGGTCGAGLVSGASCVLVVTFAAPNTPGNSSTSITINYNDGVSSQAATRSITGTATSLAVLSVVDEPQSGGNGPDPYDFGVLGLAREHTFYILNQGGGSATSLADGGGLANGFAFKGSAYPGTGGTCAGTLATGASCTVVVTFTPSGSGPRASLVNVSYNNGSATRNANRAVTATATTLAALSISDGDRSNNGSSYDYGTTGTASDHSFVVTNTGRVSAASMADGNTLNSGFALKGNVYPGIGGTCGSTLAAGSSCLITVTFTPGAAGPYASTITVAYNDSSTGRTATRAVSATATALALLVFRDGGGDGWPFDYGPVGVVTDHTFQLSNNGGHVATSLNASGLGNGFAFKGGSYPGSGGTCGTTLAINGDCNIVVTFTPSSGSASSFLNVSYNNGSSTQNATQGMTATSTSSGLLTLSECSSCGGGDQGPVDFGTAGSTTYRNVTLRNVGGGAATTIADAGGMANGFNYKGGTYPGLGGNCGASLQAGASCTLVLTYTPSGSGTVTSTITLNYNNGAAQTLRRGLIGTATNVAVLSVMESSGGGGNFGGGSQPPFDFGTNGLPLDQTFMVMNSGGGGASSLGDGGTLSASFPFKGGSYPGTGGSCGTSLAAGANCTVVLTFSPTGTGLRSSVLSISYSDGSATRSASRALIGTATTGAFLSIRDQQPGFGGGGNSLGPLDFGTTGFAQDRTFYVVNSGAQTASSLADGSTLTGRFGFKNGNYPGTGGTCGSSLAPGAYCTIVVTFSPTGSGFFSSTITLSYGGGANVNRGVTGTATSSALLQISDGCCGGGGGGFSSPPPFDFGSSGIAEDHQFAITNMGGRSATSMGDSGSLGGHFGYKDGTYPGTGGNCGSTLAPGASCTVVVTFSPSGSGIFFSTLGLNYNDQATPLTASRDLTAFATNRAVLTVIDFTGGGGGGGGGGGPNFNPPPYDFGIVPSVRQHTFTIKNTGGGTASSVGDGGTLANGFAYAGGGGYPGSGGTCGGSLVSGGTCTVVVSFSPSGDGVSTGSLSLSYNDGSSGQTATRALTATSTTRAVIAISDFNGGGGGGPPGGPFNYGTTGIAVDHAFYLENIGAQTATSYGDGGGLGNGFGWKGGSFPGTGGTCTSPALAPGDPPCSIVVTYTPSGSGSASSTFSIAYSDSGGSRPAATRGVTGMATQLALLTVADCPSCFTDFNPHNYGTWGIAVDQTFYVTNIGGQTATALADAGGLMDGFDYAGGGGYPGSGGTCGASLANTDPTCTVVLTFTPPNDNAVHRATLGISYADGANTSAALRPQTGTATTRALLIVTENGSVGGCGDACGPYDFGTTSTPIDRTLNVFNIGRIPTTSIVGPGPAAPFSFLGGSYPGTGGTCPTTALSPSATMSCTIVVHFDPPSAGFYQSNIRLDYNDGSGIQMANRNIQGRR